MNVYHFQFSDGAGIYHYNGKNPQHDLRGVLKKTKANASHMPMPQDDKLLMEHLQQRATDAIGRPIEGDMLKMYAGLTFRAARYGFTAPEQVYKWFSKPELETMTKYPVQVVVYDLSDKSVIAGESQCLFLNGSNEPCKTMSVAEFMAQYPPA